MDYGLGVRVRAGVTSGIPKYDAYHLGVVVRVKVRVRVRVRAKS